MSQTATTAATGSDLPLIAFDRNTTDEDLLRALHRYQLQMEKERSPDDPRTPYEQMVAGLRNVPPFVTTWAWIVRQPGGEIVADGSIGILNTPENQHLAQFGIGVLPALRRQGVARRILHEMVAVAEQNARRLLITGSTDRVPSGGAFLEQIGGKVGLESHTNQLLISDLDRDLLRRWQADPAPGFEIGIWEGPYPEENVAEIVALNELMNQVPRGDLDVEDFHWSAEHLRQMEASMAARGVERWTVYVRDKATGQIAGYTELVWNPHKPTHMGQGITAVWPQYRGKGLGRQIKAAMLEKVLKERPQVAIIRTENADVNAPMLKINTELGFKPYRADSVWQIETARARAYLDGRAEMAA
jgi:RimJ/RimL family protein N-acetyltransferase